MTWEHIILGIIILAAAIIAVRDIYNTATGNSSPCGKSCSPNGETCQVNMSEEEIESEADEIYEKIRSRAQK